MASIALPAPDAAPDEADEAAVQSTATRRRRGRVRAVIRALGLGLRAAWTGAVVATVAVLIGVSAISGTGLYLGAGPIVDALVLGAVACLFLVVIRAITLGIRRQLAALTRRPARALARRLDPRPASPATTSPTWDGSPAQDASPAEATPEASVAEAAANATTHPHRATRVAARVLGTFHGWLAHPRRSAGLATAALVYIVILEQGPPFSAFGPSPAFLPVLYVALAVGALAGLGTCLLNLRIPPMPGHMRRVRLAGAVGGSCLALAVILVAGGLAWTAWPGPGSDAAPPPASTQRPIDLPDPGAPGPFAVLTTSYGVGIDPRRREYGPATPIRTHTVDASAEVRDFAAPAGDYVRWFTGGGMDSIPLNALVWYPDGPGPFPLVLVVHGNHAMGDYSDPGYGYLGEHLASRGFIVASVDEASMNGFFAGDHAGNEMPVRAWLLLQHLDLWRSWSDDAASPFHGIVDMERVALMGHSRGGEAAADAAAMTTMDPAALPDLRPWPTGLDVDAVVGIAPPDGQWSGGVGGPVKLTGIDYLTIQGGLDADMAWWASMRQFGRTDVDTDPAHFKAAIWIRRANHGRFNTVWNLGDTGTQGAFLLDQASILTADEQQDVARTVIDGFLEASLMGRDAYRSMFTVPAAGRPWLPDDAYVTRLVEGSTRVIADFGSASAERATVEGPASMVYIDLPTRNPSVTQSNVAGVLRLRGAAEASATVVVRADDRVAVGRTAGQPGATLRFALGAVAADTGPLDIVVELGDAAGRTAVSSIDAWGGVLQPLATHPFKSPFVASLAGVAAAVREGAETHLQTYALPIAAFESVSPGFDPSSLATVRFRLRGPAGAAMALDEVGVAPGMAGAAPATGGVVAGS